MHTWKISEEERLLGESALAFFRETMPIDRLRKMRDDRPGAAFSKGEWREMANLGWTGILIPEEFGGMNFGFIGLGAILEAGGQHLSVSPLVSCAAAAARILLRLGSDSQKQTYLPKIAGGEHIIAVAHEEQARHSRSSVRTRLKKQGEGFVLNGAKTLCLDLEAADSLLVLTSAEDQGDETLTWVLIPVQAPGLTIRPYHLVDGRAAARLEFANVTVKAEDLVGKIGEGKADFETMCAEVTAAMSAVMLGTATGSFATTLQYLKDRKQFGVAIGTFQALQHRMAHLYSEIEVSRAAVRRSLMALDNQEFDSAMYASLAKAKLSQLLPILTAEAIQLHGGIGMTDEHDIGFYLKRSRIETELYGNAEFHRNLYAKFHCF